MERQQNDAPHNFSPRQDSPTECELCDFDHNPQQRWFQVVTRRDRVKLGTPFEARSITEARHTARKKYPDIQISVIEQVAPALTFLN